MFEEAYIKAEEGNAMESGEVDADNIRIEQGNTQVIDAPGTDSAPYDEDYIVNRST